MDFRIRKVWVQSRVNPGRLEGSDRPLNCCKPHFLPCHTGALQGSQMRGHTRACVVSMAQNDCSLNRRYFKKFLFFYIFLAAPLGTWGLSSPTRDYIYAPCLGSLNHWSAREVPRRSSFNRKEHHMYVLNMSLMSIVPNDLILKHRSLRAYCFYFDK